MKKNSKNTQKPSNFPIQRLQRRIVMYLCIYIFLYIYMYVYICVYMYICIYIYTFIYKYNHIYLEKIQGTTGNALARLTHKLWAGPNGERGTRNALPRLTN